MFKKMYDGLTKVIEIRKKVEFAWGKKKSEIELYIEIAKKAGISIDLEDLYKQINETSEITEVEDRFTDQVFDKVLLDPVQISCPGGGHGRAYERTAISQWLLENNFSCPDCRGKVSSITKVNPLSIAINELVDKMIESLFRTDLIEEVSEICEVLKA